MSAELEFVVHSVMINEKTKWPTIMLRERTNGKFVPIAINKANAFATLISLNPDADLSMKRPLSQDLFIELASVTGLQIKEVVVDQLTAEGIFTAKIRMIGIEKRDSIELDARPSDALPLAIRANKPVLVSSEIVSKMPDISPDAPPFRKATFEDLSGP